MSVPASVTLAQVEVELPAISAWAGRHGWSTVWLNDTYQLRCSTYHPRQRKLVELVGTFDGYPALPPAWRFVSPGTDNEERKAWPSAGAVPGVNGSILHSNPCICAPWSRLAYSEHNGPHSEWQMAGWKTAAPGYTRASSIADMLDQIHLHLQASPGFLE